jgi:DNA-binding NarL/FixJ family response regulator
MANFTHCLNQGETMSRPFRKLDPVKVIKLKRQGLSNSLIAQRLGVTQGAVYHVLRKMDVTNGCGNDMAPSALIRVSDNY